MAYGAEPAGADPLAHTIYVWPSRELIARSWHWPESWHAAFEQAASQIACVVASYVLGGLPVTQQPITIELPVGCIRFGVKCWGTSIHIAISQFEGPENPGPDAPGPNGGTRRQPTPADGLILGMRGTGKSFTVVTFYGPLPPIPAGFYLPSGSVPGYGYSSAMKDAGLVWDKSTLDRFIAKPDEVVPGHNMKPYGGITNDEERAKIVTYLEASASN